MKKQILILLALTAGLWSAGTQYLLLPNSAVPRFNVMDYINPPTNYGDAHVCLWEGDKEAAFTFTVDDAWIGNIDYWVETSESTDCPVTIFATTHRWDGTAYAPFPEIERLYNAGYTIQTHSAYHNPHDRHESGELNLWIEYKDSKDSLESAMPYNPCYTIAYPGGGWPNDYDTAALAGFQGGRSTVAKPNVASQIPYINTRSHSTFEVAYQTLRVCLGDTSIALSKFRNARYGWSSSHMHTVNGEPELILARRRLLMSYSDRAWIAYYPDVIRYGQERDTHTLTVMSVTDDAISFTLTDSMHDTIFTYPLTVKVKVEDTWGTVVATQNGNNVAASLKTDTTGTYVLVSAVPDQGEVVVSKGQTTNIPMPVDSRHPSTGSGQRLTVDKHQKLFRLTGEEIPAGIKPLPGVYLLCDEKGNLTKLLVH